MQGRFEEGRELDDSSRAIFEELGDRVSIARFRTYSGLVELLGGAPRAAERELRDAYTVLGEIGDTTVLSTVAALLAQAVLEQGRLDEADRLTVMSERSAGPEDAWTQATWRATRALTLRDAHDEAERLAREAVTIADGTDALNLRGDCTATLARAMLEAGRREEAASLFSEAVSLFEAKGNIVSATRARAELTLLDLERAER
jgi:tetratricopeptide (TPR) repeat protein